MTLTIIIIAGIVLVGLLGILGRRRQTNLSSWTVGERDLPRWTSWFLQAGESLTTFSFLGLAGIAFGGGVNAVFVIAYLTISSIGLYFVGPRIRELGARKGYLTIADFMKDRFKSVPLSKVVAVIGALALIPYLQLQITGLGLIVELATGSAAASGLSMVTASALVILFVLWAGIRGIARVAIFKDFGMLIGLALVGVGIAIALGGVPEIFAKVHDIAPEMLGMNLPGYDTTFFVTAVLVTGIGSSFNTMPHLWAPVLAAKSGAVLRSNFKWLAVYQLLLFIPIAVGLAGFLLIDPATRGNRVLFTTAQQTLPDYVVAIVAVFGAAAAMVPAAAISMGISTLVSRNLFPAVSDKARFRVNHAVVVIAVALALFFGLAKSDIGALLLLTYGGTTQLAPAIAAGLARRVRIGAVPLMMGMITGTAVVATIAFAEIPIGSWDSGLIALAPNILVTLFAEAVRRTKVGNMHHPVTEKKPTVPLKA
jgi:SSS family solute:Na+ symporter